MPVIQIDGNEYQVKAGDNLLQACLSLGLDLPYFCWHPAMGSVGACRQCAVVQYQNAEDQRGRVVMGCMTPVSDGAIFSLTGDKAQNFRAAIVESLMLNHPHDCPVCAEGGECHLQDMTVMVGHRDRHYRGLKNTHRNQYLGPLINHEMNRCITCYRCTRYYRDYAGGTDLAAMASHDHVYFGRHEDGVLQSEFAGNLVEVCPTGVFTDKSLVNEYTRKWDLQSAPSLCTGCAVGCNTLPGERYGKLKRVHNRFNAEVNGYFLCDRGRFGAAFVNSDKRLDYPGLRADNGRFDPIDAERATAYMVEACKKGKLAGIGSPRASIESNYLLCTLVGADNFCPGFSDAEQPLIDLALALQQQTKAIVPDIKTIESADAVFILGEDITNTAPRIALALRQSVRNKAYALAAELKLEPWQDAAIRNLAQDKLSPLFIATVGDSRLDDIAADTLHLAPDDIARLGNAVAALISGDANQTISDALQPHLQQQAKTIARALKDAHRPLIVSGTGCSNSSVMISAAKIANALASKLQPANAEIIEPMLCMSLPEANSLGLALLAGSNTNTIETLAQRASLGDIQTLVVLENDLYRRGHEENIDQLFKHIPTVIVLDSMDNRTVSASTLALPAASFAETEGTLVSMEGRAQRHFPVFAPRAERRASWAWLLDCLQQLTHPQGSKLRHFDDITQACANQISALANVTAAAPDHHFRSLGVKIPRQPQRYSGRTAMRADISVHEPKQPTDDESALAFSMEGLNRSQPAALLPFVWAPGWNSNQSLHKFQSEVGGALKGGTAGVRLWFPNQTNTNTEVPAQASENISENSESLFSRCPPAFNPVDGQWLLVPRYKIFGSDELSAQSPAISELIEPPTIEISNTDASKLHISEGDGVLLENTIDGSQTTLELRINNSIASGCAGYSRGMSGTFNLMPNDKVFLKKASNWKRSKPQILATDRGAHV